MPYSILIIAPLQSAQPVADELRIALDAMVEISPHRRAGLSALRRREFSLVLLEEALAELDPHGADLLYQNAATAPVLEINFVIAQPPRIIRQVRSALAHRSQDAARARAGAVVSLQNELAASLTGLLLESRLALREANPAQEPKLRHLVELAGELRSRLRT